MLIDAERINGPCVYELSQYGDSQDILTEFQISDCTAIAPDCEDDNAALMEFNGDAFIDGCTDPNCDKLIELNVLTLIRWSWTKRR